MSEGTWHYLSFATDEGFRGGVIVRGEDVVEATKEAWRLGCNPGGEVLGAPVPDDLMPPEKYCNRLLTKAEIDECWADCTSLGEVKEDLDIPDDATVCEHQNVSAQAGGPGK